MRRQSALRCVPRHGFVPGRGRAFKVLSQQPQQSCVPMPTQLPGNNATTHGAPATAVQLHGLVRVVQAARSEWRSVAAGSSGETDAKLTCARLLVASSSRKDSAEGLALLSELLAQGVKPSEVQFNICVGRFLRGDYAECRTALIQLVRSEPANERAAAFLEILRSHVSEHGKWGLVWLGLGVLVALGGAYAIYTWRGREDAAAALGGVPAWRGGGAGRSRDDWSSRQRRR